MDHGISYVIALAIATVAVFTDTKYGRIPNVLTFPAMAAGLALHGAFGGWSGMTFSAQGAALGLGLFLLPFLLGGMGAGDVKLLAALGAFVGPMQIFAAFVCCALVGGVMGVFILVRKYGGQETLMTLMHNWNLLLTPAWRTTRMTGFPFASAIFFGIFASKFVV